MRTLVTECERLVGKAGDPVGKISDAIKTNKRFVTVFGSVGPAASLTSAQEKTGLGVGVSAGLVSAMNLQTGQAINKLHIFLFRIQQRMKIVTFLSGKCLQYCDFESW